MKKNVVKVNKLGFLSFLAILGFFGMFTDNKGLLGFFGFACYVRYFFVTPDELFQQNVRYAASVGFFAELASLAVTVMLRAIAPSILSTAMSLTIGYVISLVVFTVVLTFLEIREQWR